MSDDLEFFKKALGKRIASLREERGFSQTYLASLINRDFQSLSRIENGRVNASGYILKLIADALETDMNNLFKF